MFADRQRLGPERATGPKTPSTAPTADRSPVAISGPLWTTISRRPALPGTPLPFEGQAYFSPGAGTAAAPRPTDGEAATGEGGSHAGHRLQRLCASCEEEEEEEHLQRAADDRHASPRSIPPSVDRLLDSDGGQPLDRETRAYFEPRLGRDLGYVRLHTGARATASARAVHALAYTVGKDVVVRQDAFQPHTAFGRRILGHELTHTLQQAAPGFQQKRAISDPGDAAEQEAERIGAALADSEPPRPLPLQARAGDSRLHRAPEPGENAGAQAECVKRLGGCPETRPGGIPTPDEIRQYNEECRRETGYGGVDVQPRCGTPQEKQPAPEKQGETQPSPEKKVPAEPPPGGYMAHLRLSETDKAAITAKTGTAAPTATSLAFSKNGPRFVLHDTATSYGPPKKEAEHLKRLQSQGSTPLGEGPAAYVTAAGAPFRTHSRFFNPQRPTATEFEKANDLMNQFTRETTIQEIASKTDPAALDAAIAGFLALFPGLSKKDLTDGTAKAKKNLDPTQSKPSKKAGADPVVRTTAAGAVIQICDLVAAGGAATLAVKGKEAELAAACAKMKPVFDARKERIPESTNVEIIADKGSDCDTSATATPFAGYAAAAYDAVAQLYVLAALEAGMYPEITTHYFLDSITPAGSRQAVTTAQNRCDPRCFDLDLLYGKIAAILGHPPGTTYGVAPLYGTTFGTSTVWWHPPVCGPTPGAVPAPTKTPSPRAKEK